MTTLRSAPWQMWMAALAMRLDQVRLSMPADLVGTIQFEIEPGESGEWAWFFVRLRGHETELEEGRADRVDTLVRIHERELQPMIERKKSRTLALDTWGRAELIEKFLKILASMPVAKSFIGIRSSK